MSGTVISGNYQDQTLSGTGYNDTISGGGGNDSISGLGGDDSLVGASGRDTILGGDGNDYINLGGNSGSSPDIGIGGAGNDTIYAPNGVASLDGGDGNDSLYGSSVANTILGGAGNDTIYGGSGQDYLNGGTGTNYYDLKNEGETAYVEDGGTGSTARIHGTFGVNNTTITNTPGTVTIGGTQQSYDFKVTGAGFDLYFKNFSGQLVFDNTTMAAPCFAEGTMIATAEGERPVETLRAGDLVATLSGRGAWFKPVRWVGHRRIDLARHAVPEAVAPVLVLPGALGRGVPSRPLRLSPDHALMVDDVLVPVGLLVDGVHVLRLPATGHIAYFHVELDAHDILLAEGAPAESYSDHGNRASFANAGVVAELHPDFARRDADADAAARRPDCAPRIADGAAIARIRARLDARRDGRAPAAISSAG